MRKLACTILAGALLACFAIFATPAAVAQDNDNLPPPAPVILSSSPNLFGAPEKPPITVETIDLTGTSEADATIKVYISIDNGTTWTEQTAAATTVDADNNWATTVTVTEGVLTGIRLKAKDPAGNEGPATVFTYVLLANAPTVTITSPTTGTSTEDSSITVTGLVSKDNWESYADLTVTIQVGNSVPENVGLYNDGNFTFTVALSEGTNTITITTTDAAGNASSDTTTVNRSAGVDSMIILIISGVVIAVIAALLIIYKFKRS